MVFTVHKAGSIVFLFAICTGELGIEMIGSDNNFNRTIRKYSKHDHMQLVTDRWRPLVILGCMSLSLLTFHLSFFTFYRCWMLKQLVHNSLVLYNPSMLFLLELQLPTSNISSIFLSPRNYYKISKNI